MIVTRICLTVVGSHTDPGLSTAIWLETFPGPWIVDIVELGEYAGEENESSTCSENSFPKCLTRRSFIAQVRPVLSVVGISDWPCQQAYLCYEEKQPERQNQNKSNQSNTEKGSSEFTSLNLTEALDLYQYILVKNRHIPAEYEKNNCTGPWTSGAKRLPATEATACHHY